MYLILVGPLYFSALQLYNNDTSESQKLMCNRADISRLYECEKVGKKQMNADFIMHG